MRREGINYVLVGAFVLVSLGLFLWILVRLGAAEGPRDHYTVIYENVSGLKSGAAVRFEGFPIGRVAAIEPQIEGAQVRYRVHLAVRAGWPVPAGSVARIVASGLLSARDVEIRAGDGPPLQPGSEIAGAEAADALAAVGEAAGEMRRLGAELGPLLRELASAYVGLARDLRAMTAEELQPLVREVRDRVGSTQILERGDALLARLERAAAGLETLLGARNVARVEDMLAQLDGAAGELQALLRALQQTRAQADRLLVELQGIAAENRAPLRDSMADLRHSLQVVARHIDTIGYDLEGAARNLNEFARQIRENPARLLRTGGTDGGEAR